MYVTPSQLIVGLASQPKSGRGRNALACGIAINQIKPNQSVGRKCPFAPLRQSRLDSGWCPRTAVSVLAFAPASGLALNAVLVPVQAS